MDQDTDRGGRLVHVGGSGMPRRLQLLAEAHGLESSMEIETTPAESLPDPWEWHRSAKYGTWSACVFTLDVDAYVEVERRDGHFWLHVPGCVADTQVVLAVLRANGLLGCINATREEQLIDAWHNSATKLELHERQQVLTEVVLKDCTEAIRVGLDHSLHNAPGRVAAALVALERIDSLMRRLAARSYTYVDQLEELCRRTREGVTYVRHRGDWEKLRADITEVLGDGDNIVLSRELQLAEEERKKRL